MKHDPDFFNKNIERSKKLNPDASNALIGAVIDFLCAYLCFTNFLRKHILLR